MTTSQIASLGTVASQAHFLLKDKDRFEARFPPAAANETSLPAFTWNQLERQLLDLAEDKTLANFVRSALARTAQRSDQIPSELILREILVLAAMVQEERPPLASSGTEEDSSMP